MGSREQIAEEKMKRAKVKFAKGFYTGKILFCTYVPYLQDSVKVTILLCPRKGGKDSLEIMGTDKKKSFCQGANTDTALLFSAPKNIASLEERGKIIYFSTLK